MYSIVERLIVTDGYVVENSEHARAQLSTKRIIPHLDYKCYRIAGNFCTVETFAVFANEPTTAKTKPAKIFYSPVRTAVCRVLSQK